MIRIIVLFIFVSIFMCPILWANTPDNNVSGDTRAITTYPYLQNFDTVTPPDIPSGWAVEDTNNDGITWESRYSSAGSAPNCMAIDYNDYIAMDDWLFTPAFRLQNNTTYRVTFQYRCEDSSYPEKMEIKWGSSPNSASMTSAQIFTNSDIENMDFQRGLAHFSVRSRSQDIYIGIHGFSDPYEWTLYLDSFKIEVMPTDPVFNITPATYSFPEQQIMYESAPVEFVISNTGGGRLFLTSTTLTGTNPGSFKLIDDNVYPISLGEFEEMVVRVAFQPLSTGSKSVTLRVTETYIFRHNTTIRGTGVNNSISTYPYVADFETGQLPPNWIESGDGAGWRFGEYLGRGTFPIPYHGFYAAVNKNTSIFDYDEQPGRNDFLVPPPFNLSAGVGNPVLSFDTYFTALNGEHANVEYSTDGETWNNLYTMTPTPDVWTHKEISLLDFAETEVLFIRFHADDMGVYLATGWAVDNVTVYFAEPEINKPTNVHVERTGVNVHITWNAVDQATSYRVYSSPDRYSDFWTLETNPPITTTEWTGNTALSRKFFRVTAMK